MWKSISVLYQIEKGKAKSVRVVGNTTGSHFRGRKRFYGDLEHFEVEVEDFRNIIDWADFLKIDVEGHEATFDLQYS